MPQQHDNSEYCRQNYDDCFLEDEFEIPRDAPVGPAVLRWIHYSLETPQVFAECVDLDIVPGPKRVPGDDNDSNKDNRDDSSSDDSSSDDASSTKNDAGTTIVLLSM